MGYRIVYEGPEYTEPERTNSCGRFRTMVAASFLIFCMGVRLCWPEGTDALRTVFLPADLTVTEEAFMELVDDVRQGHSLGDSVGVFCHRVIHEGS